MSEPSSFPLGSQITARFAFCLRELTPTEEATFLEGNGLPSGVGYDPVTVLCDVTAPRQPLTTATSETIVRDAKGAYHLIIVGNTVGLWRWNGRGVTSEGKPVAATGGQTFFIYGS